MCIDFIKLESNDHRKLGKKSLTKSMTTILCISQVWKILNAIREKKVLRQSMNKLTPISQIKEASSCFSKSYKKLHLTTYRLIVAYGYIIYLIFFYWDE